MWGEGGTLKEQFLMCSLQRLMVNALMGYKPSTAYICGAGERATAMFWCLHMLMIYNHPQHFYYRNYDIIDCWTTLYWMFYFKGIRGMIEERQILSLYDIFQFYYDPFEPYCVKIVYTVAWI